MVNKKLILIDGNSLANRAFYALPLLSNKKGLFTNAVYGIAMLLFKIYETERPDSMLVAFDAGKETFRHQEYEEYKGKRLKTPNELSMQFPIIKDMLDKMSIKHFELAGYEADDIIGTIVKKAEQENNLEIIIISGDKDLMQLVSDKTTLYLTKKGVTETEKFDIKQIKEKYGLAPEQIIDLKGLMGDQSDNIPGVPGIGEKTALKLLQEYHSVKEVITNVEKIKQEKLRENIIKYQGQALLSKKLATIFCEVPLELTINDLQLQEYDREELVKLFSELEFNSLIEKIKKEDEKGNEEFFQLNYLLLANLSTKEIENLLADSYAVFPVYINEELLCLSLVNEEKHLIVSREFIDSSNEFKEWLKDSTKEKYSYAVKRIATTFKKKNIEIKGFSFDFQLITYLLNPIDGEKEITELLKTYNYPEVYSESEVFGQGAKWHLPEVERIYDYAIRIAKGIWTIKPLIEKELEGKKLAELYYNLELPLTFVLAEMEITGMTIDLDRLIGMKDEFTEKLSKIEEEIYQLAGVKFNLNSPKQLGEILFDKLQLPTMKKTKTGYSTDAQTLEKLEPLHPVISKILDYRQLSKLLSTYLEGMLKVLDPISKKVHTILNQTITATGRLSSTEPNLQNIPIRLEEGKKIREIFVPEQAGNYILSADYSQVELRVLAHISRDENLIQAFKANLDIHNKTAVDIFNVKEDLVTPLMRRTAKAVNFGIVYGISDYGLAQNLNISRKEAQQFIERYFSIYQGVKKYMQDIVEKAKKDGYVTTLFNRRRYLPDIMSSNYNIRSFAERTAMNTPIQGTAADIIKFAMVNINNELKNKKLKSKMILQVHDELIFDVEKDELELMLELVPKLMEEAVKLDVPLKVDVAYGSNWYQAK